MDQTFPSVPPAPPRAFVARPAKQPATLDRDEIGAAAALPHRRLIIAASGFVAVSAIAGGTALIVSRAGSSVFPREMLRYTPFAGFLVPGLLLAIVIGGTALAAAALARRRARGAGDATILAGGTLTVWIVAEVAMLRGFHWLHALYGGLGVVLLGLGVRAAIRSGAPRHRWIVSVTVAETAGFLFPMCAGVLSARAGLGEAASAALIVAAGLVEGLALGTGQALAFPLPVRRARYAVLTALAAGTVWACVLAMMRIAGSKTAPVIAVIAIGVVAAVIGLAAIGTAQWLELRHHTSGARRWIAWTAAAWIVALPWSFAPGPFVDESTPLAGHLALWSAGGAMMAYAMALVTWQGVRRLPAVAGRSASAAARDTRA